MKPARVQVQPGMDQAATELELRRAATDISVHRRTSHLYANLVEQYYWIGRRKRRRHAQQILPNYSAPRRSVQGCPKHTSRFLEKYAKVTLCRAGHRTDAPNTLQHYSKNTPKLLSATPVLGRPPRTLPKTTLNILPGALSEKCSPAGQRRTKVGHCWPPSVTDGSNLTESGPNWPNCGRRWRLARGPN